LKGSAIMSDDSRKYGKEVEDRIRDLAYSMWESAGRLQGLATEFWLAAEKQVLASMGAAAGTLMPGGEAEKAEGPKVKATPATAPKTPPDAQTTAKPATAEIGAGKSAERKATATPTASKPGTRRPGRPRKVK
jgi:hypothetical protein